MLKLAAWLLNLAAIACAIWGLWAGYGTYQREMTLARARMRAQYEQCASDIRAGNPDARNRINLLMLECAESLDEDRWLPILAPNLSRDTLTAAVPPALAGFGLALLAVLLPRRLRPPRVPKPTQIMS